MKSPLRSLLKYLEEQSRITLCTLNVFSPHEMVRSECLPVAIMLQRSVRCLPMRARVTYSLRFSTSSRLLVAFSLAMVLVVDVRI